MERIPVLLAVCALAAAVAVTPAQAQFGQRVPIGNAGNPFAPPPVVGFSQSGHGVAVYEGGGVRVTTRGPSGDWSASLLGAGTNSSLAVAANGAAVIAWRESATKVRVAYRGSADSAFDANAATFTTAAAGQVAAGIDSQGNAVVAFQDGPIRVVRSTGATFGTVEDAPLGENPAFVAGERSQLDAGPRVFRDDSGNVVLVYSEAVGPALAHRTPDGTWSKATLPGGQAAVRADADPVTRVIAIATKGGGHTRGYRGQTRTGEVTPTLDAEITGDGFDVDVRNGGVEDLIVFSGGSNQPLRAAGCAGGYAISEVFAAGNYSGLAAALTSGQVEVVWSGSTSGGVGVVRAARPPGGDWAREPAFTTNGGGISAGAAAAGNAMGIYVSTESGGATYGFPYAGPASADARCEPPPGAGEDPPPGPTPQPSPSPSPSPSPAPSPNRIDCSDPTKVLQTCGPFFPLPQVCGPTGTILPACSLPGPLPPLVCGPSNSILPTCNLPRPTVVACGSLFSILPACNLPPPRIPTVCGPTGSLLPPCTGANNPITVCGPASGTVLPACNFQTRIISPAPIKLGRDVVIEMDLTCSPDAQTTPATARAAQSGDPNRNGFLCPAGVSIDALYDNNIGHMRTMTGLVRTRMLEAVTSRTIDTEIGLMTIPAPITLDNFTEALLQERQRRNGAAFARRADAIIARYLPPPDTPDPRHPAFDERRLFTELTRAGSDYLGPNILINHPLIDAAIDRWLYALEGRIFVMDNQVKTRRYTTTHPGPRTAAAQTRALRPTGARTYVKRVKIRSGKKRTRIKIRLPKALVRKMAKNARKRGVVPIQIVVSMPGRTRPVARVLVIPLRIRR